MKFFTFIMAISILTLGLMPCFDVLECKADGSVCEIEGNHEDNEPEDECTPFCFCACCGLSITLPTSATPIITKKKLLPSPLYHFLDYQSEFADLVWEPPRFV